jgi:uncharacterized membrane protein
MNLPLFVALWTIIFVASFLTALSLPSQTQLPIHWNLQFEPDNWANKWFAIMMLPTVSMAVVLIFKLVPMLEPRAENLEKSAQAYQGVFWAVQVLLLTLQVFIFNFAWKWGFEISKFVAFGLGILFIVLGNYLGKTRSTYLFGIRTPWTLNSEIVWRKTHRATGFALFGLGLVSLMSTPWANQWTLIICLLSMGIIFIASTLYSYILWASLTDDEKATN